MLRASELGRNWKRARGAKAQRNCAELETSEARSVAENKSIGAEDVVARGVETGQVVDAGVAEARARLPRGAGIKRGEKR